MIQRGGQRASSPCALESQQGVSQSWYPSVSQSVSYPVPTALGYTQSTSRAGMRAGLGGCSEAVHRLRRRLQVQHRTRHGTRAPPGPPSRLGPGGSRGLAAARYLSLRLVNRVRVLGNGPGGRPFRVWYFMQLISWMHGPNHSWVVGPRTLADILDPATSNTAESPAKAMRGAQSRHDDVLAAAVAVRYG